MSIVLRQIFQRGRGTAAVLRPRPPAPFETGTAAATIDHPWPEQANESEQSAVQSPVRPASAPVAPMANEAAPVESGSPAAFTGDEAEPATRALHSEARLLPPLAPEASGPLRTAVTGATRHEARALDTDTSRTVEHEAEPSGPANDTMHTRHGNLAEPSLPVARRSTAPMPTGSSQMAAAGPASEAMASTPNPAAAPSGGEPAARPIEADRGDIALEIEARTPQAAAAPVDAPSPAAESLTAIRARDPVHGDRIPLAAPHAQNAGPSARSAMSPAPAPPPVVEIRIGRIDVTVPPATMPAVSSPAEVGMSLDAFLAETRQ